MTPETAATLDIGWEVMKHQGVAHLFIWLEKDGWEGGHELLAWQHGPGQVAVKIKPWERLHLMTGTQSLN